MSVSFINDGEQLALYDRASGMAFGPIISGPEQVEKAEAFIAWFADGQAAEAWGAVPGVTPIWSWPHKGQPTADPRYWPGATVCQLYAIWEAGHVDDDGNLVGGES